MHAHPSTRVHAHPIDDPASIARAWSLARTERATVLEPHSTSRAAALDRAASLRVEEGYSRVWSEETCATPISIDDARLSRIPMQDRGGAHCRTAPHPLLEAPLQPRNLCLPGQHRTTVGHPHGSDHGHFLHLLVGPECARGLCPVGQATACMHGTRADAIRSLARIYARVYVHAMNSGTAGSGSTTSSSRAATFSVLWKA